LALAGSVENGLDEYLDVAIVEPGTASPRITGA